MIKGIIFDLGNTLLHFTGNLQSVEREGAEAMADWYLKKKHIKLDGPALVETFLAARIAGRAVAQKTHMEVTAQQSLREALQKIEAAATAEALAEAAVKVYFAPEEMAYQAYPDAVDTLKKLKSQGYRLGLYSNATDDKLIQRLVNQGSLRPCLSPTFSSAGWGWRKPKPEPFQLIAGRWGLSPAEVVIVGDTLNADILGAQNAGMPSILVTMDEAPSNAAHRHIQPTAVAETLFALPEIIAQL
ncbi:MAG: HAD family hydrolase [Chloroflexi bacterium]|nr:HAD family hydrolase [Chloroflexota bacterium]